MPPDQEEKIAQDLPQSVTLEIEAPLVIMFETQDAIICHLYPSANASTYWHYSLLVCDLVRNVARAFKVEEDEVWKCVEEERFHPTTTITSPS